MCERCKDVYQAAKKRMRLAELGKAKKDYFDLYDLMGAQALCTNEDLGVNANAES